MFKDLTEVERKTLIAWAIIGVLILIIAIIFKIEFVDKYDSNFKADKHFIVVKDYDRYYTVAGTMTKFYEYINQKEYKSLLNIIDEDYVRKNKLTEKNIDNTFASSNKDITFKTYIMCKKNIKSGVTEYMVEGDEVEQITGDRIGKKYYKITLNEKEMTFAIEPISKKLYGGECHE